MPRPNQTRSIMGERELARRVAVEREERGWTYESLASRMTDAGCPIQASAIYKIEKGDPPRRITVDELIAFAMIFAVKVTDLLVPREVAVDRKLARLFADADAALQDSYRARIRARESFVRLVAYADQNDDVAAEPFADRLQAWAGAQDAASGDMLDEFLMQTLLDPKKLSILPHEARASSDG